MVWCAGGGGGGGGGGGLCGVAALRGARGRRWWGRRGTRWAGSKAQRAIGSVGGRGWAQIGCARASGRGMRGGGSARGGRVNGQARSNGRSTLLFCFSRLAALTRSPSPRTRTPPSPRTPPYRAQTPAFARARLSIAGPTRRESYQNRERTDARASSLPRPAVSPPHEASKVRCRVAIRPPAPLGRACRVIGMALRGRERRVRAYQREAGAAPNPPPVESNVFSGPRPEAPLPRALAPVTHSKS